MTLSAAVEIRPVRPTGRLAPGYSTTLRKWLLQAEPDSGTLTFTEDRALIVKSTRATVFPLPATGQSDAVHTLCLVYYQWIKNLQTGITWRLLFLDSDGKVLGFGRKRDAPHASQMWPKEIFSPLEQLGIGVVEEKYATERAFYQAHPDAPHTLT